MKIITVITFLFLALGCLAGKNQPMTVGKSTTVTPAISMQVATDNWLLFMEQVSPVGYILPADLVIARIFTSPATLAMKGIPVLRFDPG